MAWLKSELNCALPASPALILEPADCAPEDVPVHRPDVLAKLAAELPAPSDALRYRDDFAGLLPPRIQRLTAAILVQNREAAVTMLLSLKVGSSMVGAPRLQHVVDRCLADIRSGRGTACLPALVHEAERFLTFLGESNDAGPDSSGAGF